MRVTVRTKCLEIECHSHHDATVRKYVKIFKNISHVGQNLRLKILARANVFNCSA